MRWVFRIVITLIILAVIVVAGLFLIPTDKIARIAEDQFEKNAGRALSIGGMCRHRYSHALIRASRCCWMRLSVG
ncbi:hypothetical protein [Litoreibacter sp.]|uniref:hypothetical protein n=1 Tax=Litoreibacter sp. TaxID=1969459 RepID=UPI003296D7F1